MIVVAGWVLVLLLVSMQPASPQVAPPLVTVRLTQTSAWPTPSPDPTGLTYVPRFDHLFISDSEVDESRRLWKRSNLFEALRSGELDHRRTVTPHDEPEDVAWDSVQRVLYVVDDDEDKVFRSFPGRDHLIGTADDQVIRFVSTRNIGSRDTEGLAYQASDASLWLSDAAGSKVVHFMRGPDGRFKTADDVIARFSTLGLGLRDPEGIEYDPLTGHVLLVSSNDKIIAEAATDGTLIQQYDISFAGLDSPSSITLAPGSDDPSQTHIYVTDRGVDNTIRPRENDGRLFEFAVTPVPPPVP